MSGRQAGLVAWGMWILGLVGIGASTILAARNPPISATAVEETTLEGFIWVSTWIGFGLVGALIVSRRPGNRIGWILSGITFGLGLTLFVAAYGRYALVTSPRVLPLGAIAAWLATWTIVVVATLAVSLVIVYPTGAATTRLGRYALRAFVLLAILDVAAFAFRPGPVEGDTPPDNPFAIPGAGPVLNQAVEYLGTLLAAIAVMAVVDLFVRFRRARGVERQQFRWFLMAIATFPILFIAAVILEEQVLGYEGFDPVVLAFALWGNGTAAAIGLAVTRHGLYEIDRIISRTVTYGLVSAVLIGVYLATVFVLGSLPPLQGELAVAGSTLLAAALFNPLRRRIQNAVDRRFNRSRFDRERTMEAMSRRLSSEVDLGELGRDLERVAGQTMQPVTVSVWVRE
jgi:hypothetical protein